MGIEHLIFPSGDLSTNSALFWCTRTREGILVDPGGEADEILDLALRQGVSIRTIVITHAHVDNLAAVPLLRDETSCGVAVHRADWPLWEAMEEQCKELGMPVPDLPEIDEELVEGVPVEFGRERAEILHIPGHSPGHCAVAVHDLGICLVGDACFAAGTGRTDLWGGSEADQERTLERLSRLPADWTLVPGHGPTFAACGVAKARRMRSTNI